MCACVCVCVCVRGRGLACVRGVLVCEYVRLTYAAGEEEDAQLLIVLVPSKESPPRSKEQG